MRDRGTAKNLAMYPHLQHDLRIGSRVIRVLTQKDPRLTIKVDGGLMRHGVGGCNAPGCHYGGSRLQGNVTVLKPRDRIAAVSTPESRRGP
jgi:hypothetical protein